MGEREWSVYLFIEHHLGQERAQRVLEHVLGDLEPYAAAGGAGADVLDVQLSVNADSLESAIAKGRAVFVNALRKAGGPKQPDLVEVDAKTVERLETELARPNYPTLIGLTELAQLLGVARQRAYQIARQKGFPEPLARLASGPVWDQASLGWFMHDWRQRRRPILHKTDARLVAKAGERKAARR